MNKRALITGLTGQDGSYLAELLLEKGYEVTGMVRRSSTVNFERIAHIQDDVRIVQGDLLDEIQDNYFDRAKAYQLAHTRSIDEQADFYAFFTPKNSEKPENHGGFAHSHWCGDAACEAKIKGDLTVTIRCLPFDAEQEDGACICCGQPSSRRVVFAKAY